MHAKSRNSPVREKNERGRRRRQASPRVKRDASAASIRYIRDSRAYLPRCYLGPSISRREARADEDRRNHRRAAVGRETANREKRDREISRARKSLSPFSRLEQAASSSLFLLRDVSRTENRESEIAPQFRRCLEAFDEVDNYDKSDELYDYVTIERKKGRGWFDQPPYNLRGEDGRNVNEERGGWNGRGRESDRKSRAVSNCSMKMVSSMNSLKERL